MSDVAALEAAQHVDDRIDLTDVGEELVAEAFALASAADQPGDVDELDLGLDLLRGLGDLADLVEPRVRHGDAADVRLDRAERIIRRLRSGGFGQSIEKRRFADVRQADDAAAEAHDLSKLQSSLRRSEAIQSDRRVAALLAMTGSAPFRRS